MSKYIELLSKIDSYDNYKQELINFKESTKYDKDFFEKILNFDYIKFSYLIVSFLILFLLIVILESSKKYIDFDWFSQTILILNVSFIIIGSVITITIFNLRAKYHLFKYSSLLILYVVFFPDIFLIKESIFYLIISILITLLNMYAYIKYRNSIFFIDPTIKTLPKINKELVCKYQKKINKIKYAGMNTRNSLEERVISFNAMTSILLTILTIILIISSIDDMSNTEILKICTIVNINFAIYFMGFVGFILIDIQSYVGNLKYVLDYNDCSTK